MTSKSQAALVTGAAKRLGRAIALHLAASGYDIALHYHRSQKEAQSMAEDIRSQGVRCELFQVDLSDPENWEPLIAGAHEAFPNLSVLVNNASVFDRGSFMESDYAFCQKQFRLNFEAPAFLTHAFAVRVKDGVVINMIDSRVYDDRHAYFYYLLSKKALYGFTRMAAAELGPRIRVNGVCPGSFTFFAAGEKELHAKHEAKLPLKRTGSPDDIARAVHSLITLPAVTGQFLYIDGGEFLL